MHFSKNITTVSLLPVTSTKFQAVTSTILTCIISPATHIPAKDEPKGEKGEGEFYVNYFDKTIGQVPDDLMEKIAALKPVKKAFISAGRTEDGLIRVACLY